MHKEHLYYDDGSKDIHYGYYGDEQPPIENTVFGNDKIHWENKSEQRFSAYQADQMDKVVMRTTVDGHVAAGLSYLAFWLTGMLFLFFGDKRPFVRFHAIQSCLFFGAVNILYFVFINIMIQHPPFIFGWAIFAFVIMNILAVTAWIVGMVNAFQGKYIKFPVFGNIAEQYARRIPVTK